MIYGTSGDDTLLGTSGGDTIYGGGGDDRLAGLAGNDVLSGQSGNDTLIGGAGDDYLMGGSGDDVIKGGAGRADWVSYEDAHWGVDISLSLAANSLTGGLGVDRIKGVENVYGSAFDDSLWGNHKDNTLSGGEGNDALAGGLGDDVLNGGNGNDTLTGNHGADRLVGGGGDDLYLADNRDQVIEAPGGGHDTVWAWKSFHLGDNVEDLALQGSHRIDGYGNGLDNRVDGNFGDNHLYGGDGADTLSGGEGADTLAGGMGADVLTGGQGADVFSFACLCELKGDLITDLTQADRIDLSAADSDITQAGVQHGFHLVEHFGGHAGEVVISYVADGGVTQALFDVNGDGQSDACLLMSGDQSGLTGFVF